MSGAISDMRPRWLVMARDHVRGIRATGVPAYTADEVALFALRLHKYGYATVQSYPVNR